MKFKSDIEIQAGVAASGSTGSNGQVLSSTGSGVAWIDQNAITSSSDFVFFNVKNETGSTILKGKGVMAVGTDGNSGHILIDEMDADGTVEPIVEPKYFLGVLEEDIPNGGFARVISFGQLSQFDTRGQNGETWEDGQVLWCDPANNGDFTTTEPDGPNVKIAAAFILNSSTNGKIQVRVQANEGIHDLHDTKITSQVDGDVLVWDNTTGVWFNDSTLNVDYDNGNVGIGNTDPGRKLSVSGAIELTSSDMTIHTGHAAIRKGNSGEMFLDAPGDISVTIDTNNNNSDRVFNVRKDTGSELFRVQEDGNVGIGTTNPGSKLHVSSSATNTVEIYGSGNQTMFSYSDSGGVGWCTGEGAGNWTNLLYLDTNNDAVNIYANDSFHTTFNAQGNVGIGTTSPSEKLSVAGNISATGDIKLHTLNQRLSFSDTAGQVSYISHHDSIGQLTIASDNIISLRETDSNVVRHTFTTNDGNYTATGVITASGGNSSNWNTAYGWGNHAGLYLGATAKAADSNLLDGIDSTGFVKQLSDGSSPNYQTPSSRRVNPNAENPTNEHYAVTTFGNSGNVTGQLATHFQTGQLYSRGYNSSWSAWRKYATEDYAAAAAQAVQTNLEGLESGLGSAAAADTTDFVAVTGDTMSGKLTIDRGATNDPALNLTSTSAGWGSGMRFNNTTASTGKEFGIYSSSTGYLQFTKESDSYGTIMRFTPNDELELKGDNLLYTGGGNVGIGTTSPDKKLEIKLDDTSSGTYYAQTIGGSSYLAGYAVGIGFDPEGYGDRNKVGIIVEGTNSGWSTGDMHFVSISTTGTSAEATINDANMTITSDGNVGIGTTSPSAKLDVAGFIRTTGDDGGLLIGHGSGGYGIKIGRGRVGDGLAYLDFIGSEDPSRGTYDTRFLKNPGDNGNFDIYHNGTGHFSINATSGGDILLLNGKVGIGTTSPQAKLDVAGGVKIADDSSSASVNNVGTLRYRTSGNNSYVDMCMQTGASTYTWVNIVQNNW